MTHNHHWTTKGLLAFGWEKTKEHFLFILGLIVGVVIIEAATSWIPVIKTILSFLVTIAVVSVFLDIVHGHTPHYRDLLKPFRNYKITWHYFLGSLLLVAVLALSLVIFALLFLTGIMPVQIIAGILLACVIIYATVRLQFFRYFIIENENMGPIEAFKESLHITKHSFWKLLGFLVVIISLNLLGLLALVIGLLFTIPISLIAYIKLYKELSSLRHPAQHSERIA